MNTQDAVMTAPVIAGDKPANAEEVPVTEGKRAVRVQALPSVQVSMALIEDAVRKNKQMPDSVSATDVSMFISERIRGSNNALRDSVLAASASVRMGGAFEAVVKERLIAVFPGGSTVANIFSCARNIVPALQESDIDVLTIPNLYGMREVSKAITHKEHASHQAVIAGIKRGDSLAKLKSLVPKVTKAPKAVATEDEDEDDLSSPVEGIKFAGSPSKKEQLRRAFDLVSALMQELTAKVSQEIAGTHLVGYTIAAKTK